ncbi:MAG: hypothetical protein HQM16_19185, partial [Deltaproteobacteria bacterium]|nr:hypothetical protein [Deltaproteobacteria bacterium]
MMKTKLNKTTLVFLGTFFFFLIYSHLDFAVAASDETVSSGRGPGYLVSGGDGGGDGNDSGQSVQADEFTGAATYSVGIPVPPARGAIEPQINLNYNSYQKDPNSWVGYGWALDAGYIERTPNYGVVDYYKGNSFQVKLLGQSETLKIKQYNINASEKYDITTASSVIVDEYQAKIESSFNIYLHFVDHSEPSHIKDRGWVVIDKGGTRYYFGTESVSREQGTRCVVEESEDDSTDGESDDTACNIQQWVAKWFLDRVVDANENTLSLSYNASKRLASLAYEDINVFFNEQESASDTYKYSPSPREGFLPRNKMVSVLDNILIKKAADRILKIQFEYTTSANNGFRLLKKITQYGKTDETSLPPTEFTYHGQADLQWPTTSYNYQASTCRPGSSEHYNNGFINYYTQFADMNGDGLLDQLVAYPSEANLFVYYNDGNNFVYSAAKSAWADPLSHTCSVGDSSCRGRVNIYKTAGGKERQSGYLMDINGDGLADRVVSNICDGCADSSRQSDLVIFFNRGTRWETPGVNWRDPYIGSNPGTSDDEHFFMDMNGDGLVDRVVRDTEDHGYKVYFNTGAGFANEAVIWKDPVYDLDPDSDAIGKLSASRDSGEKTYSLIRDFNGDGLPDRVFATKIDLERGSISTTEGDTGFVIFLNRNGLKWSAPVRLDGTALGFDDINVLAVKDPATEDPGYNTKRQEWMDFNGDGFLDRVIGKPDDKKFEVYFYRGMSTTTHGIVLSDAHDMHDPVEDYDPDDFSGTGQVYNAHTPDSDDEIARSGSWSTHTMTIDLNGDGYPDRVSIDPPVRNFTENNKTYKFYPMRVNAVAFSDNPTRWVNQLVTQPVNTLKEVRDHKGLRSVLEYTPTSWPRSLTATSAGIPNSNILLPFNLYVVHHLYFNDYSEPVTATTVETTRHPKMRWVTYDYSGGSFLVRYAQKSTTNLDEDGLKKSHIAEFNGFQKVTKKTFKTSDEDWDDIETITFFHQAKSDFIRSGYADLSSSLRSAFAHYTLSGKPAVTQIKVNGLLKVFEESQYDINSLSSDEYFQCTGVCYPKPKSQTKMVYENSSATPRVTIAETEFDSLGNMTKEIYKDKDGNVMLTKETVYKDKEAFAKKLQIRDRPEQQIKKTAGESDPALLKKGFVYDTRGNPIEEQSYQDATHYLSLKRVYNPDGTVKSETGADNVTKKFTYDSDGLFPVSEKVASPSGSDLTVTRGFNRLSGQSNSETLNSGISTTQTHDDFARPLDTYLIDASGTRRTLMKSYQYDYINVTINDMPVVLLKTQAFEPVDGYSDTDTTPK